MTNFTCSSAITLEQLLVWSQRTLASPAVRKNGWTAERVNRLILGINCVLRRLREYQFLGLLPFDKNIFRFVVGRRSDVDSVFVLSPAETLLPARPDRSFSGIDISLGGRVKSEEVLELCDHIFCRSLAAWLLSFSESEPPADCSLLGEIDRNPYYTLENRIEDSVALRSAHGLLAKRFECGSKKAGALFEAIRANLQTYIETKTVLLLCPDFHHDHAYFRRIIDERLVAAARDFHALLAAPLSETNYFEAVIVSFAHLAVISNLWGMGSGREYEDRLKQYSDRLADAQYIARTHIGKPIPEAARHMYVEEKTAEALRLFEDVKAFYEQFFEALEFVHYSLN